DEGAFVQRLRTGNHDPQAREAVAGKNAVFAVSVLPGRRLDQVAADDLLRIARRSATAGERVEWRQREQASDAAHQSRSREGAALERARRDGRDRGLPWSNRHLERRDDSPGTVRLRDHLNEQTGQFLENAPRRWRGCGGARSRQRLYPASRA